MNVRQVDRSKINVPPHAKKNPCENIRAWEFPITKTAPPSPVTADHTDVKSQLTARDEDKAVAQQATGAHDGMTAEARGGIMGSEQTTTKESSAGGQAKSRSLRPMALGIRTPVNAGTMQTPTSTVRQSTGAAALPPRASATLTRSATAASSRVSNQQYRSIVMSMYMRYNPKGLHKVDEVLLKYA